MSGPAFPKHICELRSECKTGNAVRQDQAIIRQDQDTGSYAFLLTLKTRTGEKVCKSAQHRDDHDIRKHRLRNLSPGFAANMAVVDLLKRIAEKKGATPAQMALASLLAQKPWIVPIPGTTKLHRLEENLGQRQVELTAGDLQEIQQAASKIMIEGARLPEAVLKMSGS
jgi:Aldo/keto reductase family